jgi:hypothetical protein
MFNKLTILSASQITKLLNRYFHLKHLSVSSPPALLELWRMGTSMVAHHLTIIRCYVSHTTHLCWVRVRVRRVPSSNYIYSRSSPCLLSLRVTSSSWMTTTTTNESATLSLHQRISFSLARTSRTRAAEASGRRRRKNEPSVSFSARQHLS